MWFIASFELVEIARQQRGAILVFLTVTIDARFHSKRHLSPRTTLMYFFALSCEVFDRFRS